MDPLTPEERESPGASAPVEATSESDAQSQPVVDISVTGPITPPGQNNDDVSAGEDTALESQSVLIVSISVPTTPQRQKSPKSPPLLGIDLVSHLIPVSQYIRDLTMEMLVQRLTIALRDLITNSAFVMGCTTSYHTHFTPPIDKIREELSSIPDPTATDVADLTANVMLAEWEKQCGYVISRYKTQMRRDMLRDARKEVEALKPSVLAAVDAKIKALEELEQENQPLHATPARTIRARPTTPTIDDIDTAFKSVEIRRPETPRSLRVKTIKTSTPRPSAPGHFSSPRYITSRSGTPFESPVKARARSGHKHGAMLRPDDAFPRISRAQPPPRCVFKPDD